MRSMLIVGLVGILLFAGSAASSWYIIQSQKQAQADHGGDEHADGQPTGDMTTDGDHSGDGHASQHAGAQNSVGAHKQNAASKLPPAAAGNHESSDAAEGLPPADPSQMPVALLPDKPMSVEAILQLGQSIKAKEQLLVQRETIVLKDEDRVRMMFEDLKNEQRELTAFASTIDSKVIEAREALDQLKQLQAQLDEQQQALARLQKSSGQTVADAEGAEMNERVNAVKDWFKGLESEPAASYLREFANRGDIEFAARLLDSQEDRDKANILGALNDAQLGTELMDALAKPNKAQQGE